MSGIAALIGTRSVVTLALLSLATGLPAQTPMESADLVTAGNKVPIEVFKGPCIKHIDVDFPSCVRRLDDSTPCGEDKDSSSGAWAYFASMIDLEAKAHEYGEALADWKRLEKLDKAAAEQSKPLSEAIDELRSAGAPYEIAAQLPEGSWHLHLFKRHFRAVVSDGFISQVKLRCEKKFLYFTFDPALEYEVGGNGDCMVELDGAPGTHFKLVQF